MHIHCRYNDCPYMTVCVHMPQALEGVRVQLETERSEVEDQMNLARLEVTALQEKCSALEVRWRHSASCKKCSVG